MLNTLKFLKFGSLLFLLSFGLTSCSSTDEEEEKEEEMEEEMEEECLNPTIWYEDQDGDMFGNAEVSLEDCEQPEGYVMDDSDLNDQDGFFNYTISINEPALSEYKAGESLPILVNFSSRSGQAIIGNVSYTITNQNSGEKLLESSTQTFDSPTTYQIESSLNLISEYIADGDPSSVLVLEVTVKSLVNTGELIVTKEITLKS